MTAPPRLLIITDAPFAEEGCGIDRTLQSVLGFYPPERLLIVVPECTARATPPSPTYRSRVVTFRDRMIVPNLRHPLLEKVKRWVNLSLLALFSPRFEERARTFQPEIILICSSMVETTLVAAKIIAKSRSPVIYYAMDDLREFGRIRWLFGRGDTLLRNVLASSTAWFAVSDSLLDTYRRRYSLAPRSTLVVHNAPPRRVAHPATERTGTRPYTISYAGSLWPMHRDAFLLAAEAIQIARKGGTDIELRLYSPRPFWETDRVELERLGVIYGGMLEYDGLVPRLSGADLLLVCSSFTDEFSHLSRTSVQTKVTDYLASGRPVLAIGPSDSACVGFVERWQVGVALCERDPSAVAARLTDVLADDVRLNELAKNAARVFASEFAQEIVAERVRNSFDQLCGASNRT